MYSSIPLSDLVIGARFLWRLPGFLRHPITLEDARAALRRRLEWRELDFLAMARRAIYEHPGSPYRQFLALAGCEYGDLERLVRREGVEGALSVLSGQGVYLTVEEFKGRRPAVRGSATIAVDPQRLRNPQAGAHVPASSGGSRGVATPTVIDLAFIRDRAVDTRLVFDARGGAEWRNAIWKVPGSTATLRALEFSVFGAPPVRWFSQVDPAAPEIAPRYRWSVRAMRGASLLAGVSLPCPRYVPLEDSLPIARWMVEMLRGGFTPHLYTTPSSAVRLCRAASEASMDLRGAQFTMASEPTTAARLAVVRESGATAQACYSIVESGHIGYGCLAPEAPDDMHLLHDLHAIIQPRKEAADPHFPPGALLMSSLRPTAPFMLLNVSMGDQAVLAPRRCDCPLARLGWTTHLHTIRSYEKLTAGGMTFLDTDVIRVLEEVLPAHFGGAPTDYQLVEQDGGDGRPRLRMLVHPDLGPLDTERVREVFLAAISRGPGGHQVMALLWRDAHLLQVERRAPVPTAAGKILHLHLERPAPD